MHPEMCLYKVQEELNCMEELDVSQSTPWCTGMVVVPKKPESETPCLERGLFYTKS